MGSRYQIGCRERDIHEGGLVEKGRGVDQEVKGKKGII
jgi:hypothetical protein